MSENPKAIHILEKNLDKIDSYYLSTNPNAIHIIEQKLDKLDNDDWYALSNNENPYAIRILEQNLDKISWDNLSRNPNIFICDYDKIKKYMQDSGLYDELTRVIFHPDRLNKICFTYNIELNELIKIYN